jgi:hypothetical protein
MCLERVTESVGITSVAWSSRLVCEPKYLGRALRDGRWATSSGTEYYRALRQAQGPSITGPFDKLRDRRTPRTVPGPFDKLGTEKRRTS